MRTVEDVRTTGISMMGFGRHKSLSPFDWDEIEANKDLSSEGQKTLRLLRGELGVDLPACKDKVDVQKIRTLLSR